MVQQQLRRVLDCFFLGLMSFAASRLAVYLLIRPEGMAPFWFANGVVLAVLLRRPRKEWAGLLVSAFLGFFINMLMCGFPLFPDTVYGLVNVIEPGLAATLVLRFRPRFQLRRLSSL